MMMLRKLLLMLLVLAIPFQGFASAAMLCGPNHHGQISIAEHHHDGVSAHTDKASVGKVVKVAEAKGSCLDCQTCCSGAMLATTNTPPEFVAPSTAYASFHPQALIKLAAFGLLRPPKTILV